uniref:Uncoupling mitochondrial protein n=1 Tax=Karlodinium veneficum TaxID=407301 RepID=F2WQ61_KARVE|nr:uncoupling mitochondrial protein [Karlodinium veneficum]
MGIAIGGRNGFYPTMRDRIGAMYGGTEKVGAGGMFTAGLFAGMTGYFLASPLLQVKTQMQVEAGKLSAEGLYLTGARVGLAPTYSGSFDAFSKLASSGYASGGLVGGIQSLWRGAGVIVGRGAAVSSSQLCAYDMTKTVLKDRGFQDGPLLHFIASQVGAVCCTTFSMPLDIVLTVYTSAQTLGGERKILYGSGGPLKCASAMFRNDGPLVFFRGWVPAFMRISPTTTSSFFLYEQLRRLVGIGYLD